MTYEDKASYGSSTPCIAGTTITMNVAWKQKEKEIEKRKRKNKVGNCVASETFCAAVNTLYASLHPLWGGYD